MGWVIFVLIAFLLGRLFFLVLRVAAIDPHNIEATPKAPMLALSSVLACLAFFLAISPDGKSDVRLFCAMFVGGMVIASPFKWKDRLKDAEERSSLKRIFVVQSSSIAGAILLKLLCLLLALVTSFLHERAWLFVTVAMGFLLMQGKAGATLSLNGADARLPSGRAVANVFATGCLAYLATGSIVLYFFKDIPLDPRSWMSWSGLVFGAFVRSVSMLDVHGS